MLVVLNYNTTSWQCKSSEREYSILESPSTFTRMQTFRSYPLASIEIITAAFRFILSCSRHPSVNFLQVLCAVLRRPAALILSLPPKRLPVNLPTIYRPSPQNKLQGMVTAALHRNGTLPNVSTNRWFLCSMRQSWRSIVHRRWVGGYQLLRTLIFAAGARRHL